MERQYGALSDVFGCKRGILFAYLIFGLGCLFWYRPPFFIITRERMTDGGDSTVSNELVWLIVGRIISGVGGAGMTILTSVLITGAISEPELQTDERANSSR